MTNHRLPFALALMLAAAAATPVFATPTDDPMYDSAEAKDAIQCLHRANDVRLDKLQPFDEEYFRAACARLIDIYVKSDRRGSEKQLRKTFEYFQWEDGVHHIR